MPLYHTVTRCLRNSTAHPVLHRCTTDISNRDANPGMTWPTLAFIGSCGRSNLRTCVDWRVVPSGMVKTIVLFVGVTLLAVTSITRK